MLAVVFLGVLVLAIPAAAVFGFRLPVSLVPVSFPIAPSFGYLCLLILTLLSFGVSGGRLGAEHP